MTKLFISHAHEDKDGFVRPLALALRAKFKVWYDEYELKVGDSLRERIDEGLRQCDFGVVILSKAFFGKKWPQDELNGLFALETSRRKLILPVWLGVTKSEVAGYSPILADRWAASGDKGVATVVDQLSQSISASERTAEVAVHSSSQIVLKGLTDALDADDYEKEFLSSERGTQAVEESASGIVRQIIAEIEDEGRKHAKPRYQVEVAEKWHLSLYAPYSLRLQTDLRDHYANSASKSRFAAKITKPDPENRRFVEGPTLWTYEWRPRATKGLDIAWEGQHGNVRFAVAQVADQIIEHLVASVYGERNTSSD